MASSTTIPSTKIKENNDSKLIYSQHGDGELQEGQNWEAIKYASAKQKPLQSRKPASP